MRQLLCLFLLVLLSACMSAADPDVAAPPSNVRGEALPGRLLFVTSAGIWQWQGREARLFMRGTDLLQPRFSPDGTQIVYVRRSLSASDLLIADQSGREVRQLTANQAASAPPNSLQQVYSSRWAFYPTWAPDRSAIIAATQAAAPVGEPPAEYNLALYRFPLGDSGAPTPLYGSDVAHLGRSVFAPNGDLIFVRAAIARDGQQQVYRLDPTLGTAAPLLGAPTPSYDPALSPDGAWLLFAAQSANGTDLFALPASGGVPQQLTELGSARAPAFAPDGTQVAFLAIAPGGNGFDLWISAVQQAEDGSLRLAAPRRLTTEQQLDADSGLSWAP
jgi:TolB protein